MQIGYARISTSEQNLDLQIDALTNAGCDKILQDVASGAKKDRDGLEEALMQLRKGDTLVVWKLDRLGRSLKHLIEVVTSLNECGVYFKSLQENIDTSSSGGKLIFHIFGALAEFERDIIRSRTKAGLESARARSNNKIGVQLWAPILPIPITPLNRRRSKKHCNETAIFLAIAGCSRRGLSIPVNNKKGPRN